LTQIPYGRQSIDEQDIQAVVEVLKSDFLTQGPLVPMFEQAVCSKVGAKYATAVNSATSALHLACLALGVQPGDLVWTSAITFVASANCAIYCGATVEFIDIDSASYNMSVDDLEQKLKVAREKGYVPKVVIPVHLSGLPCDMKRIHELSQEYGFSVIEDASHAIGAEYQGSPVGSCKYSDITVFSFHPVKIITTGEGGLACTNSDLLHQKMALLRSHGVTRDPEQMSGPSLGSWYYEQIELGFNYRMTDIQAALGISQLAKLDLFVTERAKIADQYDRLLANTEIASPQRLEGSKSAHHLYIIRVPDNGLDFDRRQVFERLRANGILANLHYMPLYRQPFHSIGAENYDQFPNSEAYFKEAISIPIYPSLTSSDIENIVSTILKPLGHQTFF
jgi:UDP-4-amino-4,6-dideoxy-N-acetyl-beta-L-altrosamine transaminase